MSAHEITHHYAGVLLITKSGKMIGQQRDDKVGIDNPGKVATFGGTVEDGETYRFAAWRELVEEETSLTTPEDDFNLFFEDKSWRPLTSEWEERHFYTVLIDDETLDSMEVYEGQGWIEITGVNDPNLVDAWRNVIKAYLESEA